MPLPRIPTPLSLPTLPLAPTAQPPKPEQKPQRKQFERVSQQRVRDQRAARGLGVPLRRTSRGR